MEKQCSYYIPQANKMIYTKKGVTSFGIVGQLGSHSTQTLQTIVNAFGYSPAGNAKSLLLKVP